MNRSVSGCIFLYLVFESFQLANAQSLKLEVRLADLHTWITNDTAVPLTNTGYSIDSASGMLDPAGWRSIHDASSTNPTEVSAALGSGALTFMEIAATSNYLVEGSLIDFATWQPGTRWSIGYPFGTSRRLFQSRPFDATFLYAEHNIGVVAGAIDFIPVPEPAGITLAVAAVLATAFLRGRRQS